MIAPEHGTDRMLNNTDMLRLKWLDDYEEFSTGKTRFKLVGDGSSYVAIIPFLYTTAIIFGEVEIQSGYRDRWCYEDFDRALAAFEAWDGIGEPEGWHRHPGSGRRRPKGEPAAEYLAP